MILESFTCKLNSDPIDIFYGKAQCECTTGRMAIAYDHSKVVWARTEDKTNKCSVCGEYYFLFLNGKGAKANAKYLSAK